MNRQDKAAAGMLAGVKARHAQARMDNLLAADAALPCWPPYSTP